MSYTLRVSVVENCQLGCNYCLPEKIIKKKSWLSLSQYEKIAHALKKIPITKIRFTGGEPLLRKNITQIIKIFKKNFLNSQIALTTNGLKFANYSDNLVSSGLQIINFHLDTLVQEKYKIIMGKGCVEQVLENILLAKKLKLTTKLNIVIQKNTNTNELGDFINWGYENKIKIRFIELMNTGISQQYVQKYFISGAEILKIIKKKFKIKQVSRELSHDPAENYYISNLNYYFGLIRSDTKPFCQSCNRLRLSCRGDLAGCLYQPVGLSLKNLENKILEEKISQIIKNKKSYHPIIGVGDRRFFSMSETGG